MSSYPYVTVLLLLIWSICCFGQVQLPVFTVESTPLSCSQDANSSLSLTITDGFFPIHYSWRQQSNGLLIQEGTIDSPNLTVSTAPILSAGIYVLTLEDNNGLIYEDTFPIMAPQPIQIGEFHITDATCANDCDGSLELTFTGGTGLLTIHWQDDPADQSFIRTGLCAGDYLFQVVDEAGCTQKGTIPILSPEPITAQIDIQMPTCLEAANGQATVTANGGIGSYSFNWSDGEQGNARTNLSPALYEISVIDENNCALVESIEVFPGPPLIPNVQIQSGCGDGNILISCQPIHGSPPYQYQWSTGSTNAVLTSMSAGNYNIQLTDDNGCFASTEFQVPFIPAIAVSSTLQPTTCSNAGDGMIALNITGGTPPFQVSWSNGMTGQNLTNLPGGEYTYNVAASGCGRSGSINLPEPLPLDGEVIFTDPVGSTLTGQAIISGGTPPYVIRWNHGPVGATVFNLEMEAEYSLEVTDANNCQFFLSANARLTNVDNWATSLIEVFPNPTSAQISIHSDLHWDRLEWLDITGRVMSYRTNFSSGTFDLVDWPSGLYLLRLHNENTLKTYQVFKE